MLNYRNLRKSIRPKILRRQIFLRCRLPQICPVEDVNFEAFDRVAVFTKSRIAFNRLRKNANSTAMIALTRLETGQLLNDRMKAKHDANRMDSASSLICDLSSFDWLLIVRDPYSRTLSAFLEKFQHESYIRKYGRYDLSPAGFHRFLSWLKDGGLSADYHWNLQTANIFLPVNRHNRIIRFETFGSEFLSFLQEKDRSVDGQFFSEATTRGGVMATNSAAKVPIFYDSSSRRLVSELFEKDFRILGYPV